MKPWTREDTKEWIIQLENRIEDIDYYLKETTRWCEDNFVYDDKTVFMCSFLTCLWVCHMRNEIISYKELLEILGLEHMYTGEDSIYNLGPQLKNVEHEDLLKLIVRRLDDF
jgi:hypothetical protein